MNVAISRDIDQGTMEIGEGVSSRHLHMNANVTGLCAVASGRHVMQFACGLGNGDVVLFDGEGAAGPGLRAHGAAVTGMVHGDGALYSTGQDGRLLRHDVATGASEEILAVRKGWLHGLAFAPAAGLLACIAGREIIVAPTRTGDGTVTDMRFDNHPSTVAGLAFSPDGRRLAAAHYDGVTLWALDGSGEGELLTWKGSHVGVSWSPDGRFVVSATQERELHIWDLVTGKDYRLGGYAAKTHSLAWTNPELGPVKLACSGADVITAWPFGDVGPGRLPPVEIGYVYSGRVTKVGQQPGQGPGSPAATRPARSLLADCRRARRCSRAPRTGPRSRRSPGRRMAGSCARARAMAGSI